MVKPPQAHRVFNISNFKFNAITLLQGWDRKKKNSRCDFFFARLQFEFWLGFMGKSTFLMEAHDKRAQRGSVSQRAVGLSSHSRTPRRVEALGGGGHGRLLPKARARPLPLLCDEWCTLARWAAHAAKHTNRRSRMLFFELTARVWETRFKHLIQVAATCWKAATPGSLCLVHSVVLCCIPMNRRATPSD